MSSCMSARCWRVMTVATVLMSTVSLLHASTRSITSPLSSGEISVNVGQALVKALYKQCNLNVRFREMPPARAFIMAEKGLSDGELGRVRSAVSEKAQLVAVPELLYALPLVPVSLADHKASEDETSRWGILLGFRTFSDYLPDDVRIIDVRSTNQLVALLRSGRIDHAMMMGFDAQVQVARNPSLVAGEPLTSIPLYHFIHKSRMGDLPCLARELRKMKEEGRYERLIQKTLIQFLPANTRSQLPYSAR